MCDYIIVTISMDGLLQKSLMWFISVFFSYKSVYILQKKKRKERSPSSIFLKLNRKFYPWNLLVTMIISLFGNSIWLLC